MNTITKRVDELVTGDVIVGVADGYTITVDGPARGYYFTGTFTGTKHLSHVRHCPVTDSNGYVGTFEYRADHMVTVLA